MPKCLLFLIAVACLVIYGCSEDDNGVEPDGTPPLIAGVAPGDGRVDVPRDTVVTVTFNEYIDASTVTQTSFTVSGVAGDVSCLGAKATFVPAQDLDYSTLYTATVTTEIADRSGNHLEQDFEWSFTTAPPPWTAGAPMPTGRDELAVAVCNGIIYAIGGSVGGEASNVVEAYDPVSDTWSTCANMPTARLGMAAVALNDTVYAIAGGTGGGLTNAVEAYDPVSNTWTTRAPLPYSTSRFCALALDGRIYCIGGYSGQHRSDVEEYDPAANSWTSKADMPTARSNITGAVVGSLIYIYGGTTDQSLANDILERYDPYSDTWSTMTPAPTARWLAIAGAVEGVMYAVGGNVTSATKLNEAYDMATDSWAARTAMPSNHAGGAGAVVGDRFFVIGGLYGDAQALHIYEPSVDF
jgi:N-acetylneuraminic acid mutarotase